jgi:hypothetical protein
VGNEGTSFPETAGRGAGIMSGAKQHECDRTLLYSSFEPKTGHRFSKNILFVKEGAE